VGGRVLVARGAVDEVIEYPGRAGINAPPAAPARFAEEASPTHLCGERRLVVQMVSSSPRQRLGSRGDAHANSRRPAGQTRHG
jgi:hypothetical protein